MEDITTSFSAADQVVEYVKNGIKTGRFKLGDKLPSEAELGYEIGVGRSSLREGMTILRAFGLVDIRRGDGTYIDNKTEQNFIEVMGLQVGSTTADLMVLRKVLESGTIGLACTRISDAEIDRLQELTDYYNKETDVGKCTEADQEFHLSIMRALGNPLIISLDSMILQSRFEGIKKVILDKTAKLEAYQEHQRIVDALRARDPQACSEAIMVHINHTIGNMIGLNLL